MSRTNGRTDEQGVSRSRMFNDKYFMKYNIILKINLQFLAKFQKVDGTTVTVTLTVTVKTFSLKNVAKMK